MRIIIALAAAPALIAMSPGQDAPGKGKHPDPLAALPAYAADAGPQPETAPDQSDSDPALAAAMDRIEAAVKMPAGAQPIAGYARYYAWADKARTKVTAVYLHGGHPGRKWIGFDDLPLVLDGGCGVVSLVFDAASGTIDEIYCNGAA